MFVIIGPGKDLLSFVWPQAIAWANADIREFDPKENIK